MTLQSSSTSHCRTRLLAQQRNTIVFTCVPVGIGTHSSPVSCTMTMCILVLSPTHVLCSRCSSLLSIDNKCLASYSSTDFSKDWDMASSVPKTQRGTTKAHKCYFYFFKTISLALGPRSYPSPPGFGLYLHLGILLQLGVALPRHLLEQPQSSFSPLSSGATHFSSLEAPPYS